MRPPVAAAYCGGEANLKQLEADYGLKPVKQRKSNTVYDIHQIDRAINEANLAEWKSAPTTL